MTLSLPFFVFASDLSIFWLLLRSCLFVLSLSVSLSLPTMLKCRNPSTAFYQAFPCSRLLGSKPLGNRYELGLPWCVCFVFTHESACTEQLSLTSLLSFLAWRMHGIVGTEDKLPGLGLVCVRVCFETHYHNEGLSEWWREGNWRALHLNKLIDEIIIN